MLSEFTRGDVADLAAGAALLGTGGGGSPYIGRLIAENAITTHGPIPVVAVDDLPDDAFVVFASMIGAPTVLGEKLPGGNELVRAMEVYEAHVGREITHVLPSEVGGLNSTVPLVAAATRGVPIVDGDGMGRAFPEIQMVTPTIHGIRATPMAIADEKGNAVVLDTIDNHWTERLGRNAIVQMGSVGFAINFAMTAEQVRQAIIPGTLTAATELGRLVRHTSRQNGPIVERVATELDGAVVFTGKVVDIERRTTAGFSRGRARLEGTDEHAGSTLELEFQNEYLVAVRDGAPVVTVPDLIIVVDEDLGQAIPAEDVRFGYRTAVIAAPCHEQWRTPGGLQLAGPKTFGYDWEYVPFTKAAAT